ncbi:hypothetical protein GIB67_012394, partial [Kingdonia uniflora]
MKLMPKTTICNNWANTTPKSKENFTVFVSNRINIPRDIPNNHNHINKNGRALEDP